MTEVERKTWRDWDDEAIDNVRIIDPDGFRRDFHPDARITRDEFLARRQHCSVIVGGAGVRPASHEVTRLVLLASVATELCAHLVACQPYWQLWDNAEAVASAIRRYGELHQPRT